jgi:hypothetical protein
MHVGSKDLLPWDISNYPQTFALYYLDFLDFRFVYIASKPKQMSGKMHGMYIWSSMTGERLLWYPRSGCSSKNTCQCLVGCVAYMFQPEQFPGKK